VRKRGVGPEFKEALRMVLQAIDGLAYAHDQKIVHRDVKPANILLSGPDAKTAKLADFGLAKQFDMAGFSGMTVTGHCAGSPAYIAPEQILDFRYAKPPVDVFSMAATFYRLVTGMPPRDVQGREGDFLALLKQQPIPILERGVPLPAKVAALIDLSLAKEPARRPQDAAEFRDALLKAVPTAEK